ncbi:MAG: nuclear transport factor 2 family protein [Gammaproteobacteria bacterium]
MQSDCIEKWHEVVTRQDTVLLADLLSDEVVFFSPVVHTPQKGKAITLKYLSAALEVLANDSWAYVSEMHNENRATLEFETVIDGITINGVDLIRWNERGKIVEFKVMVRPLKAIGVLHQKMAEKLAA